MALVVALVFLLLLTLMGISSIQNATLQEKMAGNVKSRNESFQMAEAALRLGESAVAATAFAIAPCPTAAKCLPPAEASTLAGAGTGPSGVVWVEAGNGFYGIQRIGTTRDPAVIGASTTVVDEAKPSYILYRITGIGLQGASRTVLESIHAILDKDAGLVNFQAETATSDNRRIMWRQRQ
jgi:type IV pilus assembly protein PilX